MNELEQAVIDEAITLIDHLGAFNDKNHPEVHASLLRLAQKVSAYHHRPTTRTVVRADT